jgi:hypothetical protein
MNKHSRRSAPFATASEVLLGLLLAAALVQIVLSFSAASCLVSRTAPALTDVAIASVAHTNSPTNAGLVSKPARG